MTPSTDGEPPGFDEGAKGIEVAVLFQELLMLSTGGWEAAPAEHGPLGEFRAVGIIGNKAGEAKLLAGKCLQVPATLAEPETEALKAHAHAAAFEVKSRGLVAMHEWFAETAKEERVALESWAPFAAATIWITETDGYTHAAQTLVDALVVLVTKGRRLTLTRGMTMGALKALAHAGAPLLEERDILLTVVRLAHALKADEESAFYDVFTMLVNEARKSVDGQRVVFKLRPRMKVQRAIAEQIGRHRADDVTLVRRALEWGARTEFRSIETGRKASSLWIVNEDPVRGIASIQLADMLSPSYAQTVRSFLKTAPGRAAVKKSQASMRDAVHELLLIPVPPTATLPLDGVNPNLHAQAKRVFLHVLATMAGHAYLKGAKLDVEEIGAKHGLSAKQAAAIFAEFVAKGVLVVTEGGGHQLGELYNQEHRAMLETAERSDVGRRAGGGNVGKNRAPKALAAMPSKKPGAKPGAPRSPAKRLASAKALQKA